MPQKIAVAVIHGIGKQGPDFADDFAKELKSRFAKKGGDNLVIRPVYWAGVLQGMEDEQWKRLLMGGPLDYTKLRKLLIDFIGDAFAYQPIVNDRATYDSIHAEVAQTFSTLAQESGGSAPLCIVAHSLGSVIASNFIYDLQKPRLITDEVRAQMHGTPLERGETITLLYTIGSPLALFSLRYKDFGKPIRIPAPKLAKHYADLKGEWVNYYDRDDVIAYPLKTLNPEYKKAITEDHEVNVGGLIASWNPLTHIQYWKDDDVIEPIVAALVRTWKAVNP
jgi:hypothetical protein